MFKIHTILNCFERHYDSLLCLRWKNTVYFRKEEIKMLQLEILFMLVNVPVQCYRSMAPDF